MPRILIADDNQLNAIILKSQLKQLGLEAETAFDGRSAFTKHQLSPYEIIFLDYSMPDINGAELGRMIRNFDGRMTRHTHLFTISADPETEISNAFSDVNIVKHLQKPITQQMLSSILVDWTSGLDKPVLSEPPAPEQSELVSWHELMKWLPTDPVEIQEFIDEFRRTTLEGIDVMTQALEQGDYNTIANCAHRLKAPPSAFGMLDLSNIFLQIQHAASLQLNAELQALIDDLKQCYNNVDKELRNKLCLPT